MMKKLILLFGLINLTLGVYSQDPPQIILKVKQNKDLGEKSVFDVKAILTLPSSSNASDGVIELLVTGGTEPYSYNWGEGESNNNIQTGLIGDAEYEVYVTDAKTEKVNLYIQLPNRKDENTTVSDIPEGYRKFYVSSSGSDLKSGLSEEEAWETLAYVQKKINDGTIGKGCAILFKAGDTFLGGLEIDMSLNEGEELYIGSYGAGKKPVWNGTETLKYDANLGDNVYRFQLGNNKRPRLVILNKERLEVSQLPLDGWYEIDSDGGTTSIFDSQLQTVSWTQVDNASVICYTEPWALDEEETKSLSGSELITTSSKMSYSQHEKYKFFNDQDILTENTFASDGQYLYIKSQKDLSNAIVNVCGVDYALELKNSDFIIIDNIHFTMFQEGVHFDENFSSVHNSLHFTNNTFEYIQDNGFKHKVPIYGVIDDLLIENCTFNKIGGSAINLAGVQNSNIINNNINLCGYYIGSSYRGGGHGIIVHDSHTINVKYNRIDSVRGVAIQCHSSNKAIHHQNISYNYISYAALGYSDIGAIYTVNGNNNESYDNIISNNIIENIPVVDVHIDYLNDHKTGIYTDEKTYGYEIKENTIINSPMGIYAHQAHDVKRNNNNIYNCGHAFAFQSYSNPAVEGNTIDGNIIALFGNSFAYEYADKYVDDEVRRPKMSNNKIIKFQDSNVLDEWYSKPPWEHLYYTVESMAAKYNNTTDSMIDVSEKEESDCIIKYNATDVAKNISLPDGTFSDVFGNSYSGEVKLEPYTSIILLKK